MTRVMVVKVISNNNKNTSNNSDTTNNHHNDNIHSNHHLNVFSLFLLHVVLHFVGCHRAAQKLSNS